MKPMGWARCLSSPWWRAIAAVAVIGGGSVRQAVAQDRPAIAQHRAQAREATPAPPFVLHADSITHGQARFLAHVRSLRFLRTPEARDERYLMLKNSATEQYEVGPHATVEPEAGAPWVTGDWAAWGRVLARVTLSAPYPPWHMDAGETYVCVRDMRDTTALALVIGVAHNVVTRVDSLTLHVQHLRHPLTVARFIFTPRDDGVCFPCNNAWCCAQD